MHNDANRVFGFAGEVRNTGVSTLGLASREGDFEVGKKIVISPGVIEFAQVVEGPLEKSLGPASLKKKVRSEGVTGQLLKMSLGLFGLDGDRNLAAAAFLGPFTFRSLLNFSLAHLLLEKCLQICQEVRASWDHFSVNQEK